MRIKTIDRKNHYSAEDVATILGVTYKRNGSTYVKWWEFSKLVNRFMTKEEWLTEEEFNKVMTLKNRLER